MKTPLPELPESVTVRLDEETALALVDHMAANDDRKKATAVLRLIRQALRAEGRLPGLLDPRSPAGAEPAKPARSLKAATAHCVA